MNLDQCKVAGDGLLHDVVVAVEGSLLAWSALNLDHTLALVLDWGSTKVNDYTEKMS